MKNFEFHQPTSLIDASKMLQELGPGAIVYAGGTDVIPRIKLKKLSPLHLINIKRIPGLKGIEFDNKTLTLGTLVRFNDIIYSPIIQKHFPILVDVSKEIASHQVRNLATIGGNLCNAAPSADSAPVLIALGSRIKTYSSGGVREFLLEDFFRGPSLTSLAPGEILTHIMIDKPVSGTKISYIKHKIREALEIAITGVAVSLNIAPDGTCKDVHIVVAACASTPLRATKAEALLKGTSLKKNDIELAMNAASKEIFPIDDVRGCARYRREMTAVSLKRAIEKAMAEGGN
jgi:carbon-monoxide dehydrogenase medium subunit